LKITDIQTLMMSPSPGVGGWIFVKVVTDEGIEGIGETSVSYGGRDLTLVQHIDEMKQWVVGESPFDIEKMWQRMYALTHDFHHPGILMNTTMSAIEVACWDIIGKAVKQPIYNLLGGRVRDKIRVYTHLGAGPIPLEDTPDLPKPEAYAKKAVEAVERGFTGLKWDTLGPIYPNPRPVSLKRLRYTEECVKAVRDAVGDEADILVETHGKLDAASVIRLAKRLEKYDPLFLEEPVPPENIGAIARVAQATSIPIATGERLFTKFDFFDLLEAQGASVLQLDVIHCGGFLEAKKIAAMAEARYVTIAPHMPYGPVAGTAAIHLDTCSPNFLIQEWPTGRPLMWEIVKDPPRYEKGYIIPPTKPGLGIELNEDIIAQHPWTQQRRDYWDT
jgi:galactonate dehydratase